jgi:hypothetical protein
MRAQKYAYTLGGFSDSYYQQIGFGLMFFYANKIWIIFCRMNVFSLFTAHLISSFFTLYFILFYFFCAPWAYYKVFSGADIVSGTLHPAVWDTHLSS